MARRPYVFTSIGMYMLNINKNNPIRPLPSTRDRVIDNWIGRFLCTHNSCVTITQLQRRTEKNSKSSRLLRILHPQFHEIRFKYHLILNVIASASSYCLDHQLVETLKVIPHSENQMFFSFILRYLFPIAVRI